MSTVPIFGPQSPFLGLIPGGLRLGQTLRLRVTINGYASRCHINIQSGAALRPRDDTVLHISIRPQENAIIRNHFQNQVWGQEERHGGFPLTWQDSFEISITPHPNNFRIKINDKHYCTFNYRLPITLARFISIDGGCMIQYINLDEPEPGYSSVGVSTNVNAPYPPGHNVNLLYPIETNVPYPTGPVPIMPAPGYPQFSNPSYQPPAPPPMPNYAPPPPYPGNTYPSPYSASASEEKKKKGNLKLAAGVGAVAGLTAVAVSSASRNLRKARK